jgi:hypothetical protein
VRTAVSPGHARPSGSKLSVLFRRGYAFTFAPGAHRRWGKPSAIGNSGHFRPLIVSRLIQGLGSGWSKLPAQDCVAARGSKPDPTGSEPEDSPCGDVACGSGDIRMVSGWPEGAGRTPQHERTPSLAWTWVRWSPPCAHRCGAVPLIALAVRPWTAKATTSCSRSASDSAPSAPAARRQGFLSRWSSMRACWRRQRAPHAANRSAAAPSAG